MSDEAVVLLSKIVAILLSGLSFAYWLIAAKKQIMSKIIKSILLIFFVSSIFAFLVFFLYSFSVIVVIPFPVN